MFSGIGARALLNGNVKPHKSMPPMNSFKPSTAVFIGAAIGMALSYVVLFIFGLVFLWTLVAQGVPGNESYARAYESTPYLLFAHFVGFLCLLPGGLWTVRLSENPSFRYALYAGLLVALFALLGNLVPYYMPIPLWSKVASIVLPVPAFILGARLQTHAA